MADFEVGVVGGRLLRTIGFVEFFRSAARGWEVNARLVKAHESALSAN